MYLHLIIICSSLLIVSHYNSFRYGRNSEILTCGRSKLNLGEFANYQSHPLARPNLKQTNSTMSCNSATQKKKKKNSATLTYAPAKNLNLSEDRRSLNKMQKVNRKIIENKTPL